jgi:hypothetical protein
MCFIFFGAKVGWLVGAKEAFKPLQLVGWSALLPHCKAVFQVEIDRKRANCGKVGWLVCENRACGALKLVGWSGRASI